MAMHENRYKYTNVLSFIRPFSIRPIMKHCYRFSTSRAGATIGVAQFIRIFYQIRQAKCIMFHVVAVHESLALSAHMSNPSRTKGETAAPTMRIETSSRLHASSRLYHGNAICWYTVHLAVFSHQHAMSVRIGS